MRIILILENNPFVESNASSNRWLTIIYGLKEIGVKFHIFILNGYKRDILKMDFHKMELDGIKFTFLYPHKSNSYLSIRINNYFGAFYRNIKIYKKLMYLIAKEKGIIWVDCNYLLFRWIYRFKKQNPDRIYVVELNEFLDIHRYNKVNILQFLKAEMRYRFFEDKAFHQFSSVIFMTKELMVYYEGIKSINQRFLHLPMTVDLDRFENSYDIEEGFEKPYVAYIGVLNDKKDGISILINSFKMIANDYSNLKLYLVGPWQYDTPKQLLLIKKLNLEDRVFWKKSLPRESIPSILKNAELLVLPRPDSKQAKGGFPTKLGEYLASGRPVCATKVGEISNYLEDEVSVFFAEPNSIESFAFSMRKVFDNVKYSRIVGEKGRKVAENYFNKRHQATVLYNFFNVMSSSAESSNSEEI
jgi:glycosyltransferase involved in cell wall biosynthesis